MVIVCFKNNYINTNLCLNLKLLLISRTKFQNTYIIVYFKYIIMSDQEGELIKTGKIVIRNMAIIYMGLLGLVTIYTMLPINPIIVVSGLIVIIGVGCLLSVGIILMLYWHSKRLNIA